MAKFLSNIDLVGNELQNFVVQPLAGEPSSQVKIGRKIFDTSEKREKIYDGVKWKIQAYLDDLEGATSSEIESLAEQLNALSTEFDALKKALTEDDTQGIINTWEEIQSLVKALPEDSDLAVLIAEINSRLTAMEGKTPYILATSIANFDDAIDGSDGDGVLETEDVSNNAFRIAAENERPIYIKAEYGHDGVINVDCAIDGAGFCELFFSYGDYKYTIEVDLQSGSFVASKKNTTVSVTAEVTSGTHIATIKANGRDTKLYAPDYTKDSKTVKKKTVTFTGDGSTTSFQIDHGLGVVNTLVCMTLFEEDPDTGRPYQVMADMKPMTMNSAMINFSTPPASGTNYMVLVIG